MNCKPGDLAIVVRGAKSGGRIVRCIRLVSMGAIMLTKCGRPVQLTGWTEPVWALDGWVVFEIAPYGEVEVPAAADSCLRPIRDPGDDAKDEMLRPLPQEVCA